MFSSCLSDKNWQWVALNCGKEAYGLDTACSANGLIDGYYLIYYFDYTW